MTDIQHIGFEDEGNEHKACSLQRWSQAIIYPVELEL